MLETAYRVAMRLMARLAVRGDRLARVRRARGRCARTASRSRPASTLRLVGLFLLVPPAVFFAVAIAIRRILRRG